MCNKNTYRKYVWEFYLTRQHFASKDKNMQIKLSWEIIMHVFEEFLLAKIYETEFSFNSYSNAGYSILEVG